MSTRNFKIKHHNVEGQHIRELPDALAVDENTSLHLRATQYIPLNNPVPNPGDFTIVALHANTFTHELYEPLWDDLLHSLPPDLRLRGIWMIDLAQQGQSYLLNETKLASGISWEDHPRDVLHIINTFRNEMPSPLLGVGHSMGAAQLTSLCRLHPRLFHAVAFLDPWMAPNWTSPDAKGNWKRSFGRKDRFESREQAKLSLRKTPVMRRWDQRVFDKYIETHFRSGPTLLYPNNHNHNRESGDRADPVVLTTPKQLEMYTSTRANLTRCNIDAHTSTRIDRLHRPDMHYSLPQKTPYYMPLPKSAGEYLPHLRPRALYLYGQHGSASKVENQNQCIETTGTGSGGSGGIRVGAVESSTVSGSHFFPFERPDETARTLATWIEREKGVREHEVHELKRRLKESRAHRTIKAGSVESTTSSGAQRSDKHDEREDTDDNQQDPAENARRHQQFPPVYGDVARNWDEMFGSASDKHSNSDGEARHRKKSSPGGDPYSSSRRDSKL